MCSSSHSHPLETRGRESEELREQNFVLSIGKKKSPSVIKY